MSAFLLMLAEDIGKTGREPVPAPEVEVAFGKRLEPWILRIAACEDTR